METLNIDSFAFWINLILGLGSVIYLVSRSIKSYHQHKGKLTITRKDNGRSVTLPTEGIGKDDLNKLIELFNNHERRKLVG